MKRFTLFLLFTVPFLLSAQSSLQNGFDMMDKGNFQGAAAFFQEKIQKEGANDKTTLLCYGRAVGLSGNIAESQTTFRSLLTTFPDDYEVTLNLGESFLWAKQAEQALPIYKGLVEKDSNNFVALLGMANTYSAMKNYEMAAQTIDKALTKNSPHKQNAKVSKKYILLALADTEIKKRNLSHAKEILTQLLNLYPNDKDVLFLASTYHLVSNEFAQANNYFSQVIAVDSTSATTAYLGMSYAEFMMKQANKALKTSEKAIKSAKDSTQLFQAYIGKVNALGWNKKFKTAFSLLDSLTFRYPNKSIDIQSAVARLRVWDNQANKGIDIYEQLLQKDTVSRDLKMGYIDALIANSMEKRALKEIEKNLIAHPDFVELKGMQRKIALTNSLQIKMQAYQSFDNGNNRAQNLKLEVQLPSNGKFKPNVLLGVRKLTDSDLGKSTVMQIAAGGKIVFNHRFSSNVYLGVFSAKTANNTFTQPYFDFSVSKKMGKRQSLDLGVKKDIQTYNSSLVNQQLKTTDFRLAYATSTTKLLGFYTEDILSRYGDGNRKTTCFGSLYLNLKKEPVVKTGINATYLSFQNQHSEQYFSPKKYFSGEVFFQLENLQIPRAKFLYQVFVAVGQQKIEDFSSQNMYRGSIQLGYRWADSGYCTAYYKRSNSLSTNVLGYGYNEIGIECKINLVKNK